MSFFKQQKINTIKLPVTYSCLTPIERKEIREEYIRIQKNKCYYCNSSLFGNVPYAITLMRVTPELYPKSFFNSPIHLHHDHKTDLTIGAVHAYCNAVLWEYEGE